MKITIISKDVRINGVNDIVYEISINDGHHYYIRKNIFEKLENGEYLLVISNGNFQIYDKSKNLIERLNSLVY